MTQVPESKVYAFVSAEDEQGKTRLHLEVPVVKEAIAPSDQWTAGKSRLLSLNRLLSDSVGDAVQRLQASFNSRYFETRQKKKLDLKESEKHAHVFRLADCRFLRDLQPLNAFAPDTVLDEVVREGLAGIELVVSAEQHGPEDEVLFQKEILLCLPVHMNPARLHKCTLPLIPLTGCPTLMHVEGQANFSFEHSLFEWYVAEAPGESPEWPAEPTFVGPVFHPRPEHLGRFIKARVFPHDANGTPGKPYQNPQHMPIPNADLLGDFLLCPHSVQLSPNDNLLHERLPKRSERQAADKVRVISYNLLADMYASSKSAASCIFIHSPLRHLGLNYRIPLQLRELASLDADILCLQEVERPTLEHYLQPFLNCELGLDCHIQCKRGQKVAWDESAEKEGPLVNPALADVDDVKVCFTVEKSEGPAVCFRRDRFELVGTHHRRSLLEAAEHILADPGASGLEERCVEVLREAWHSAVTCGLEEKYREKSKAHSFCGLLLRDRLSDKRIWCVASTHLNFHPRAEPWRRVQALTTQLMLRQMTRSASQLHGCDDVAVVLGADLNSDPPSSPCQLLLHDIDGSRFLQSAYPLNEKESDAAFTNWVPRFSCVLDYILLRSEGSLALSVDQVAALPTKEQIALLCATSDAAQETSHEAYQTALTVDPSDRYALPNAHFPSDHLALAADLRVTRK